MSQDPVERRRKIIQDSLDDDLNFNVDFPGGFSLDIALLLQILRELRKR